MTSRAFSPLSQTVTSCPMRGSSMRMTSRIMASSSTNRTRSRFVGSLKRILPDLLFQTDTIRSAAQRRAACKPSKCPNMNRFCVFPDANLSIESPNPIGRKTALFNRQLFHSELLKQPRSDLRKRLRSGRAAGDIRIFETGSIRVLSQSGDFSPPISDRLKRADRRRSGGVLSRRLVDSC